MKAGEKIRLKASPSRVGMLTGRELVKAGKKRLQVNFFDGTDEFVLEGAIERVTQENSDPYAMFREGRYGPVEHLRGALTHYRLSGKLANLIYSMNTTNTEFYAYQFKPVLSFLESPSRGILIADEVGLGKTIEAGLIWTELRSRFDARRLLVICPAILREKWKSELWSRFGIDADICTANQMLGTLRRFKEGEIDTFALIGSFQGLRPSRSWDDDEEPGDGPTAQLARLLIESEHEDPLFDLVIIDEAHYLRNPDTLTAKLGKLVRSVADAMVLLSATPIQMDSADLYSLVRLLDEDNFALRFYFENTLRASKPLVTLRDHILAGVATPESFTDLLRLASGNTALKDNQQIQYLLANPPTDETLSNHYKRSELADIVDRINPLSQVITRTRKRDVHERKVVRNPVPITVPMTDEESAFYHAVTARVRKYCSRHELAEGFLLTIPQRQMTSSMAAACRAWKDKLQEIEQDDDFLYEAMDVDEESNLKRPKLGPLLQELVRIANELGDYGVLRDKDSKYQFLLDNLREYWAQYPDNKIILFSFYRGTLNYLHERLSEEGIDSMVLMGGMDKQEAMKKFADPLGPKLLLASEVASEGVDLQFSSLLINYDLPWNPMKIEQRIGRIDRIGQKAAVINIWNIFHEGTIDQRVYEKLFLRLEIFKQVLGSLEAVLTGDMKNMSFDLFRHELTPEQEDQVIEQTYMALANRKLQEEALEEQASHLIAHGDYIQNKVKAAQELKRFVTADDIYYYFRDFFEGEYEGTRIRRVDDDAMLFEIDLSSDPRYDFSEFLRRERLLGKTRLVQPTGNQPVRYLFQNTVTVGPPGCEVISQYHPVIRFISERYRAKGVRTFTPVISTNLPYQVFPEVPKGIYAFAVSRWSMRVATRDIERLAYHAIDIDTGEPLDNGAAEKMVNTAALQGTSWLGAKNALDGQVTEDRYGECVDALDDAYHAFVENLKRENADRISLQLRNLDGYLQREKTKLLEVITRLRHAGKLRGVKLNEDKLKKLSQRVDEQRKIIKAAETPTYESVAVTSGVVLIK